VLETVAQQLQRAHPDDVGAREEDSDEEARSGGEHAERADERISFTRQQSESRRRQRTSHGTDRPRRRDHGPEQQANTDNTPRPFFMVALWNRAYHYILMLWFVLLSFFLRLILAAADWMSAILPHMVWP